MIKVYIGISGSGKTTQCLKDLSKDPKGVRVNRDDLRYAVYGLTDDTYGDYFKRDDWYKCEQFITDLEDRIINRAISKGKNIYCDNTHLKQKYIKKYYKLGIDVELEWIDCDVDLAIHRDLNRGRTVGNEIIKKQLSSYEILKRNWKGFDSPQKTVIHNDINLPDAVIFDIDGTLSQMDGRSPYEYDKVHTDKLRKAVYEAYEAHRFWGNDIIICTGRDGSCSLETREWLADNNIEYDKFYTRDAGDVRPDWKVKEEMWAKICNDYHIVCMYDDRLQVIEHARSLGFNVFDVAGNSF